MNIKCKQIRTCIANDGFIQQANITTHSSLQGKANKIQTKYKMRLSGYVYYYRFNGERF